MARKNSNLPPDNIVCSFCGRSLADGILVIPSEKANICEDCVRSAGAIIDEMNEKMGLAAPSASRQRAPTPKLGPVPLTDVKCYLLAYIV